MKVAAIKLEWITNGKHCGWECVSANESWWYQRGICENEWEAANTPSVSVNWTLCNQRMYIFVYVHYVCVCSYTFLLKGYTFSRTEKTIKTSILAFLKHQCLELTWKRAERAAFLKANYTLKTLLEPSQHILKNATEKWSSNDCGRRCLLAT